MSSFNRVILIGRLTRDPELRYTASGIPVTNFTLAIDRNRTSQAGTRETDFIDVVAWQKLAETCANYLKKGKLVLVEGRLQIRPYETADGQKRRQAEVIAATMRMLESKGKGSEEGGDEPGERMRSPEGQRQQVGVRPAPAAGDQAQAIEMEGSLPPEADEINLDEVPF